MRSRIVRCLTPLLVCLGAAVASAQTGAVTGVVRDQTGGALPGVTVELTAPRTAPLSTTTDAAGRYRIDGVPAGSYALSFRLLNFGDQQRKDLRVDAEPVTADAVLSLSLSADVVVVA